jgi:hypothetical protein
VENVTTDGGSRLKRGAARLGILDILTALVLLAVLLYASWRQFPAFNRPGELQGHAQSSPKH